MELPRLKGMYERLHGQGLEIVTVRIDKNAAGAQKFISDNQLPYLFLVDDTPDGSIHKGLYGCFAYPTTFIIDRAGMIRYYHLGFEAGDETHLEEIVAALLREPAR